MLGLCTLSPVGQGGQGGGAFGGGGQGGGVQGPRTEPAHRAMESAISAYLNGEEVKSILTPGEFNEWKLTLKAGQVVFSEAWSDAFDPAIEVVDAKNKVLATNDDRFPGDQRPLLMWRCEKDGEYALHIRSFNNKAGGQFFMRMNEYASVTPGSAEPSEAELEEAKTFLVRVPMKTGQIKDLFADREGQGEYLSIQFGPVIVPIGLPEHPPFFAAGVAPAIRAIVASVDGDYYVMATPYGRPKGKVRIGVREFVPAPLQREGEVLKGSAPTRTPHIWKMAVKTNELLEVSAKELALNSVLLVAEAPDFSGVDLAKPETNPLFPQWKDPREGPAIDTLPGRARDGRVAVFRARRDTTVWITSNGDGPAGRNFSVTVRPAAADYLAESPNTGDLRIGKTDYWAFDAQAGDVMSLDAGSARFALQVIVRDPDLRTIRQSAADPDQTHETWRLIVQRPGRYLVGLSAFGDGGAGEYTLSRTVFSATECSVGKPAKGEISDGDVQIWKFTATPDVPLLIHWSSSAWTYDVSVYDEKGNRADFQRQAVDAQNTYGILKVDQPRTFVVVLMGRGAKAAYTIDLAKLR